MVLFDESILEFGFTALAPLGERVARNRRFHQAGRDG